MSAVADLIDDVDRIKRARSQRAMQMDPSWAAHVDAEETADPNPWIDRVVAVDDSWIKQALPPRRYLMRDTRTGLGSIPWRGFGCIVAAGGVGKSFATIDMTLSVACGISWCGYMKPERAGRVLILTAEDPADDIRRRMYDQARARGVGVVPRDSIVIIDVHDRHLPFLDRDARPTSHVATLLELVAKLGPFDLVVVDPLARISGASIDGDNVAACALATALESVATQACGFVLGVHHTSQTARRLGITDATAIRGATGLGDSARLVMVMTAESVDVRDTPQWSDLGEIITLSRAKANHVARWEPIELRRGEHGVLLPLDSVSREIVTRARVAADPAVKRKERRQEMGRQRYTAAEEAVLRVLGRSTAALSYRQLRAALRAELGECSDATLDAALARLGNAVVTAPGPKNATLHSLAIQEAAS